MSDLSIKLDYLPNRTRPEEVFQAMAVYIDAYRDFGQLVNDSLGVKSDFYFKLDAVEVGSIRSNLSVVYDRLGGFVGDFLFSAAGEMLGKLVDKTSTEDQVELIALELEKDLSGRERGCCDRAFVDPSKLAHVLKKFSNANEKMQVGEKVSFSSAGDSGSNVYRIDERWRFVGDPDKMFSGKIEHFDRVEECFEVVTVVNKGAGLWSFGCEKMSRRIDAKIADVEWLRRYQSGLIMPIGPKDRLKVEISYDLYSPHQGRPSIRGAVINCVKEVLRNPCEYQSELGFD